MKNEKEEETAFISEAADRLMPFGGSVKFKKFDKSPALVAQNATSVYSASSSSSEDEDCTQGSTTSFLSSNSLSNSSSITTSTISSGSSDFEYLAHL
jgi:hypothetical protein